MIAITQEQLDTAVEALRAGKVIVFPTETSYGLGADATNAEAVERLFKMKGRDREKAIPLLIPRGSLGRYVLYGSQAERLSARYWPGPLNIILPTAPGSQVVSACASNGMQSVRVTPHPFASVLVERFGGAITATSANLSGEPSLYSAKEAMEAFSKADDQPDFVVDVGDLPRNPPSTTVRISPTGGVEIVRLGGIVVEVKA